MNFLGFSSRTSSDAVFHEEGQKILESLNLDQSLFSNLKHDYRYHPLDPIWCHPETKAMIFVGNQFAASSFDILSSQNITHIVNCTTDMPNYFSKHPDMVYFRFPVSEWQCRNRATLYDEFILPMFQFIENALNNGQNVLIHCLAGAHRAGTTGVACLMYFGGFTHSKALVCAKTIRPVINPFSHLTHFLVFLEKCLIEREKIQK
jgi:protein-tyrosine phosphatase